MDGTEYRPSETDRLQAQKRIGDPLPEGLVFIYVGETLDDHIIQILKEKAKHEH
jgi:hypothetical protein